MIAPTTGGDMPKPSKSFVELLVILGAASVLVVGFAIVQATWGNSTDDRTAKRPLPTPTETVAVTPPVNTPTAKVVVPSVAAVTVPLGALIQTAEQAVDRGLEYARGSGADHPRLVKVELMTLGEAMTSTKSSPNDVADVDALGWDLGSAAWRVQFDNDEFDPDSCEPPADDADDLMAAPGPYTCPTEPTAIYIFLASDGLAVTIALGYPVPQ
jgi:hypothetical protein